MAQIYYYDPQSAGINLQSPQSDSTPWSLTLSQGQCCKIPFGTVSPRLKYTETNLPEECHKVRASDLHRPMVRKFNNPFLKLVQ